MRPSTRIEVVTCLALGDSKLSKSNSIPGILRKLDAGRWTSVLSRALTQLSQLSQLSLSLSTYSYIQYLYFGL